MANPLAELKTRLYRPARPCILLIDALDESENHGQNKLLELLAQRLHSLPDWIRAAVSSRPEDPIVEQLLRRYQPLRIDCDAKNNQEDIRLFVTQQLAKAAPHLRKEATDLILGKAQGQFLFVRYAMDQLRDEAWTLEAVQSLPSGIDGFYLQTFERHFPLDDDTEDNPKLKKLRPLLQILVSAQEEFTLHDVARVAGQDMKTVLRSLEPMAGLLGPLRHPDKSVQDGRIIIKLFHKSVRDWLVHAGDRRGELHKQHAYYVNPTEGHARLAHYLWEKELRQGQPALPLEALLRDKTRLASYGVQYVGLHALQASEVKDCASIAGACLTDYWDTVRFIAPFIFRKS
jgi:hypothetical protein